MEDNLIKSKMDEIRRKAESCKKCDLWKTRNKPVFGEGPEDAKVLLIGLGPGYHENLEGRPFVGSSGKLLDKLLKFAGWTRNQIYITNIIKSYLPENKATNMQIKTCTIYLDQQIDILKPKIIILLGNIATKYIFQKYGFTLGSMSSLHGKVFTLSNLLMNTKIIPMYHPAAVLRNPTLKNTVEDDWKKLNQIRDI
jgi:DNA polymerase